MSTDQFGIKKLHETVPGGREFYLPEIDIPPVEITRWHTAPQRIFIQGSPTEMEVHGERGSIINPNGIWYVMNGNPRLYVIKGGGEGTWEQYLWHDVEMTCYYLTETTESNQMGISMGAISWHHMEHEHPEVYTYYLKHHFEEGVFTLQKEWRQS